MEIGKTEAVTCKQQKKKSIIPVIILVINIIVIIFLIVNHELIANRMYASEDKFMGMKFNYYRYSISKFSMYFPHYFIVAGLISLFFDRNRLVKTLVLVSSIVGLIISWKAFDYFRPW